MWIPLTLKEQAVLRSARLDGTGNAERALRRYLFALDAGGLDLDVADIQDVRQRAKSTSPYAHVDLFLVIVGAVERAGIHS